MNSSTTGRPRARSDSSVRVSPRMSASVKFGAIVPTGRPSGSSLRTNSPAREPQPPKARAAASRRSLLFSDHTRNEKAARASAATVAPIATSSAAVRSATHASIAGPGPCQTRIAASTASTALRASVQGPAGAEWTWPKQLQSGARPRSIAVGNPGAEPQQERQRRDAAPAGRGIEHQGSRRRELGQRQQQARKRRRSLRNAEIRHRAARALQVEELGGSRKRKHPRQQQLDTYHQRIHCSPMLSMAPRYS